MRLDQKWHQSFYAIFVFKVGIAELLHHEGFFHAQLGAKANDQQWKSNQSANFTIHHGCAKKCCQ